ncbi:MAG: DUF2232 domain-containing protein [Cyanothece sp. SIO1E1]|nr:DUF2232 domain-containing protein [Cyanothece sp. SIO1E1]
MSEPFADDRTEQNPRLNPDQVDADVAQDDVLNWAEPDPWVSPDASISSPDQTSKSLPGVRTVPSHRLKAGPLAMVETAFLASTASLIWLVNYYFPAGPLLRVFFPVPIALVYLRWGHRAAWMSTLISGLLLSVLMGPPRSILFVIPYGLLGMQLGAMWMRLASWVASIMIGAIIVAFGVFFRLWLLSAMLGEDLWVYLTTQITQLINWVIARLVDWKLIGLGTFGQPDLPLIQLVLVGMVLVSSVIYLFAVHLVAWLLLERLGAPMPSPPGWIRALLDE